MVFPQLGGGSDVATWGAGLLLAAVDCAGAGVGAAGGDMVLGGKVECQGVYWTADTE